MQIRTLLIAMAWLVLSCGRSAQGAIREGDVVFQTSRSAQSQAIQLATHSPYSHMQGRPAVSSRA